MKNLFKKHQKIIVYFCCSAATAVLEFVLGWFFLKLLPGRIVPTNTAAIIISAVCHYFITLKLVFRQKSGFLNAVAYAATFVLGIALQDTIIWVLYDILLKELPEFLRYSLSKIISLGLPFLLLYYLRSELNRRISDRNRKKNNL